MDLWIRCQNRQRIIECDDIHIRVCDDKYGIFGGKHMEMLLGYYESEERAFQVLDEIQDMLTNVLIVRNTDIYDKNRYEIIKDLKQNNSIFVRNNDRIDIYNKNVDIYEMPKE
jgi:hypothetical protein